jgi:hypothetical protein
VVLALSQSGEFQSFRESAQFYFIFDFSQVLVVFGVFLKAAVEMFLIQIVNRGEFLGNGL